MSRHGILTTTAGVIITVLVASQSAIASGSAGQIRAGLLLGYGISDQEDVNRPINDIADDIRRDNDADQDYWSVDGDELGGGLVYGGFAEYRIVDNLVVGAEFIPLSSDGGLDFFAEYEDNGFDLTQNNNLGIETHAKLLSAYGAYLLPISDGPVMLRLGGGVGYLAGAELEMDYDFSLEGGPQDESGHESLTASGSAVAFHAFAGAEYRVMDHLIICANASYRVASVDELEVDKVVAVESEEFSAFEYVDEGEILKWKDGNTNEFSTEEGDNIGLDFGGFYFTVSAAFTFGP